MIDNPSGPHWLSNTSASQKPNLSLACRFRKLRNLGTFLSCLMIYTALFPVSFIACCHDYGDVFPIHKSSAEVCVQVCILTSAVSALSSKSMRQASFSDTWSAKCSRPLCSPLFERRVSNSEAKLSRESPVRVKPVKQTLKTIVTYDKCSRHNANDQFP